MKTIINILFNILPEVLYNKRKIHNDLKGETHYVIQT